MVSTSASPKELNTTRLTSIFIFLIIGLMVILLGLGIQGEFDLLFALLQLLLLGTFFFHRYTFGVLAILAVSTMTGIESRFALFLSNGKSPSLDFIRFTIELVILLTAAYTLFIRGFIRNRITNKIDFAVWGYLAISTLQVFNIAFSGPLVTIWGWRWVCLPMLMYFVGRSLGSKFSAIQAFYAMIIVVSIILTGYAVYQMMVGLPAFELVWFNQLTDIEYYGNITSESARFIEGELRVPSMTVGHTYYSLLAAYFFLLLLFMPRLITSATFWKLRGIALILMIIYMSLSLERTTVGMVVLCIIMAVGLKLRRKFGRAIFWGMMFLAAALFILVINQIDTSVVPSVKLRRILELINPFNAATVQWRIQEAWHFSLQKILRNPLGYGLGTAQGTRLNVDAGSFLGPHNMYLQILLEQGVIGLLFIGVIIRFHFQDLFKLYHRPRTRKLALSFMTAFVAILAVGVFNLPLEIPLGFFFWFTIGLLTSHAAVVNYRFDNYA